MQTSQQGAALLFRFNLRRPCTPKRGRSFTAFHLLHLFLLIDQGIFKFSFFLFINEHQMKGLRRFKNNKIF